MNVRFMSFKSRSSWFVALVIGLPVLLIVAFILIPGCYHQLVATK